MYLAFLLSYSTVCKTKPFLFLHLIFVSLMYIVYMCICVCAGGHPRMCVEAQGWHAHHSHFSTLSIVTGLYMQAWVHWSTGLVGCPGVFLSLLAQCWVSGKCCNSWLLHVGPGNQTLILMFACQTVDQMSHLPSFTGSVFKGRKLRLRKADFRVSQGDGRYSVRVE